MNEPRRLREEGSELERALIASASSDAPSPRARAAAARALGIDPTPGGSGAGPSGGSVAATMSGGKIAGFIGLAALVALAAWQLVVLGEDEIETERTTDTAPPPPAAEPPPAPPAAPVERATDERPPDEARSLGETSEAPRSGPIRRARPSVEADAPEHTEPVTTPSTLAAEVAALDAARSAIRSGRTAHALALLDEYDARFARPELGPESDIARIEAHLAAGDRAAARSLADRFLAAHPTSPAAARIRRLVPESSGESTLPER
jgi:hypothetical protein